MGSLLFTAGTGSDGESVDAGVRVDEPERGNEDATGVGGEGASSGPLGTGKGAIGTAGDDNVGTFESKSITMLFSFWASSSCVSSSLSSPSSPLFKGAEGVVGGEVEGWLF